MEHIKTHKIPLVRVLPGDSIHLHYSYQPTEDSEFISKVLKLDTVNEPMTIDTIIVYRVNNEYGLKAGRALIMGEADA